MSDQEKLEQLESLKYHCISMSDDEIFQKDVEALEWAIGIIKERLK